MRREKRLQDVVQDMKRLAESLNSLAMTIEDEPLEIERNQVEEKAPLTLSDMQSILIPVSQEGHTKIIKAVLTEFGAAKLSDVAPEKYDALLEQINTKLKEQGK